MLAALIRQVSVTTQVIVSTQSALLLDHFQPEDVLVADRVDDGTQLRRLESSQLEKWLEDYSLGQLWEKNEIGGLARSWLVAMVRLLIHVEGETEEIFVKEVLSPHLLTGGFHSVSARIVGHARQRSGIRRWPSVRTGIMNHLKEDPGCVATTMVDYYGLPPEWPGRTESKGLGTILEKAQCLQDALLRDLATEMGDRFNPRRFVPFVVMHEFEGLLFSDCAAFSRGINRPDLEKDFREIREHFATPEEINDSPDTAPSKRIESLVPGYQKPFLGLLAALEVGLDRIRAECPHFDGWLKHLESLAS
jgi:hypothetical protein